MNIKNNFLFIVGNELYFSYVKINKRMNFFYVKS